MPEQLTEAQPVARNDATGRLGRAKDRIVAVATGLANTTDDQPSGWYVNTGEGTAVSAGSEDLKGVDLGSVLGQKFAMTLDVVVEVNSRDDLPASERYEAVEQSYSARLAQQADESHTTTAPAGQTLKVDI